jgi:hypothetical protein
VVKEAIASTLEWLETVLWVFTVIVAIGVVGEAVFGIWHVMLSKRLRNLQRIEDQKHEEDLLAANQKLEEERTRRLEMEAWLSPRILPIISGPGGENWVSLKPFSGTDAIIKSVVDEESGRAAGQIAAILQQAGWKIVSVTRETGLITSDGVTVWYHVGLPGTPEGLTGKEGKRSREKAEALVDLLHNNGWDANARMGMPIASSPLWVPPNTVIVEVGLKPNPYISPGLPKDVQELIKQVRLPKV